MIDDYVTPRERLAGLLKGAPLRYRQVVLVVLIISLITLAIYWWTRVRRIPTLRFTFILGKGASLDLDWLDLKPNAD